MTDGSRSEGAMGGFSTRGYYPRTEIIGDRARLMLRLMAPSWTARWSSPAPSRRLACTWRGGDVVTAGCRWLCCAVFLLGVCVLSVALSSWFGFVGLGMGAGPRQRTKHPAAAAQRGMKGPLWRGCILGVRRLLPLPSEAHPPNYFKTFKLFTYFQAFRALGIFLTLVTLVTLCWRGSALLYSVNK